VWVGVPGRDLTRRLPRSSPPTEGAVHLAVVLREVVADTRDESEVRRDKRSGGVTCREKGDVGLLQLGTASAPSQLTMRQGVAAPGGVMSPGCCVGLKHLERVR
jgi:hypothetical protein